MTAEEWEEIKTLFEAAMQLPPDDREEYLRKACAERPAVYQTVLDLLENHVSSATIAGAKGEIGQLLRPGELVGDRFRVVRFIAAGGMGEVYEAFDESLRTKLAMKVLRVALLAEPGARERFQRELLTARQVSHQNLCKVYDLVEHRRQSAGAGPEVLPCLSMELLDGESLADYLQKHRPLTCQQALPWIGQIAAALDVLHAQGMVHRDLKPSNVMLARRKGGELSAVVMDFGLAKAIDHDPEMFESRVAWNAGSPYFMAPELLRHGRATVASDIYAFGLLIDEMVTETRAFPARSLPELYYSKLWDQPLPPAGRAKDLPPSWATAIETCLRTDPAERHLSAGGVVRAIETPAAKTPRPGLVRRRVLRGAALLAPLAVAGAALRIALSTVNSSVDVFDVENKSGRADLDYLCRGTTQEVLRRLEQLKSLRVVPMRMGRASAGKPPAGGQFRLAGNLQDLGTLVRLRMELTDGESGHLIWSQTFDGGSIESPVTFQQEIAQGVVAGLENRILFDREGRAGIIPSLAAPLRNMLGMQLEAGLAQTPTRDNQALDDYMRGSKLLEEITGPATLAAIGYFERAVARDPSFALAHAAVAQAYLAAMGYEHGAETEFLRKARESSESAVRMGPELAEGFAALAAVRQAEWDWSGAEQAYLDALRLKPGFARVHRWYAGLVLQFARFDEAIHHARTAMELDPYDRATPASFGMYLFLAGRYKEAAAVLESSIEGREATGSRYNLGQVYARMGYAGRGQASVDAYHKALEQAGILTANAERESRRTGKPANLFGDLLYALVYILSGHPSANQHAQKVREHVAAGRLRPVIMAAICAIRKENEEALRVLEDIHARREQGLNYIRVDPFLENLRGEPRFQTLLKQLRLQ
ncbi:MAG: protein kinase [Acidobacteria bacterium]|nr:protein kinase [Acidobacteriota bacterium]